MQEYLRSDFIYSFSYESYVFYGVSSLEENFQSSNIKGVNMPPELKCKFCGRKKTLSEVGDDVIFCTWCQKSFSIKDPDIVRPSNTYITGKGSKKG